MWEGLIPFIESLIPFVEVLKRKKTKQLSLPFSFSLCTHSRSLPIVFILFLWRSLTCLWLQETKVKRVNLETFATKG